MPRRAKTGARGVKRFSSVAAGRLAAQRAAESATAGDESPDIPAGSGLCWVRVASAERAEAVADAVSPGALAVWGFDRVAADHAGRRPRHPTCLFALQRGRDGRPLGCAVVEMDPDPWGRHGLASVAFAAGAGPLGATAAGAVAALERGTATFQATRGNARRAEPRLPLWTVNIDTIAPTSSLLWSSDGPEGAVVLATMREASAYVARARREGAAWIAAPRLPGAAGERGFEAVVDPVGARGMGILAVFAPGGGPCAVASVFGNLYVDPAFRGQGLGTSVVRTCAEWRGRFALGAWGGELSRFTPAGFATHRRAWMEDVEEASRAGRTVPDEALREHRRLAAADGGRDADSRTAAEAEDRDESPLGHYQVGALSR